MELLALAASTVSSHMDLRRAGLVQARKYGRWVYYRLSPAGQRPLEAELVELSSRALAGDATIEHYRQRLNAISSSGSTPCPNH